MHTLFDLLDFMPRKIIRIIVGEKEPHAKPDELKGGLHVGPYKLRDRK